MATPKFCPACRCAIRNPDADKCARCGHEFAVIEPSGPQHLNRPPFAFLSSVAILLDCMAWLALLGSFVLAAWAFDQTGWLMLLYPAMIFPQALLMFAASGILRLCLDIRGKLS